ncbi:MAG: Amuc_1098 family type IV pilus outer membrane protein [Verrucomicrobiaceae bacterium]
MLPQIGLSQSVSGLANREIMRRYARIEDAKAAIARGDNSFREANYEDALSSYQAAVQTIPSAPYTAEWLQYAELKYADCAVVVAKERAKSGKYDEARQLLDGAIVKFPDHKAAKVLLRQLDDPDRWPPALTSSHVDNVKKVEKGLILGNSSVELGNYDQAITQYQDVLRVDPYNSAARRGMENAERQRGRYLDAAYDQQRARMLNQVTEMWEDKVPLKVTQMGQPTVNTRSAGAYLTQKMDTIVFPTVAFENATIEEAIEYLRIKSKDLDTEEPDPTKKGVNIIIRTGDAPAGASISLDLKNVPMSEALRYICDLAQMKYKVEAYAVVVVPISESSTEMFTRTYRVPPDFLAAGGGGGAAAPAAAPAADPFAAPAAGNGGSALAARPTAKDVLMGAGITFPDGASASFTAATSTLVVRNTQPNLDLVETYVEELNKNGPKQVVITSKFVEVSQKNTDELGFDWLLGGVVSPGNGGIGIGGGSPGSGTPFSANNYPFGGNAVVPPILGTGGVQLFPQQTLASAIGGPVPLGATGYGYGGGPITSGNRSGSLAITDNSIDTLLSTGSTTSTRTIAPGILSVAGVFTDPQFQTVMRGLSQKKGVDLMSAPSVTTKGGTRATMSVVREFIYPTEFDPPQLPQGNQTGGGLLGGGGTNMIATPTTPTAFETRNTGVTLEAEPTVGPDGNTIELNLSPEVVEFDGFVNYGSPILSPSSSAFQQVTTTVAGVTNTSFIPLAQPERLITPNIINQPIFSVRKVTTGVTVWDGQTVALGGLIREDVQDVEDKLPILGDLPFIGRLFRSESEQHFKRNLMIFVTAYLIDPSGQKVKAAAVETNTAPTGVGTLLPTVGGN